MSAHCVYGERLADTSYVVEWLRKLVNSGEQIALCSSVFVMNEINVSAWWGVGMGGGRCVGSLFVLVRTPQFAC